MPDKDKAESRSIIRKAVALKYEKEKDQAPVVVAKGQGWLAEQILKLAEDNDVTIHHDASLVDVLKGLELGQEIPPDLYEAVALVLAYVMEMDEKMSS